MQSDIVLLPLNNCNDRCVFHKKNYEGDTSQPSTKNLGPMTWELVLFTSIRSDYYKKQYLLMSSNYVAMSSTGTTVVDSMPDLCNNNDILCDPHKGLFYTNCSQFTGCRRQWKMTVMSTCKMLAIWPHITPFHSYLYTISSIILLVFLNCQSASEYIKFIVRHKSFNSTVPIPVYTSDLIRLKYHL